MSSSASKRAAIAARAAVPSGAPRPVYAPRLRVVEVVPTPLPVAPVVEEVEAAPETWTRADCAVEPRPCVRLTCRHHLLWAQPRHRLRLLSDDELAELVVALPETCTLDFAERDRPPSLEEVGAVLGVTRERVRQIEAAGLGKIRRRLPLWRGLRELGGEP